MAGFGRGEFRTARSSLALHFRHRRHQSELLKIIDHRELGAEIREDEHTESDLGFVDGELGFLKIPLALLQIDLRADYIGVGRFPAFLQLLGDVEETLRFANAGLSVGELALSHRDGIVILDYGLTHSAGGNVDLGARDGFGGLGPVQFAAPDERQRFLMHDRLFVIDVHSVIGDENAGGSAIAFGINELIEGVDRGAPGRAGLQRVLAGLEHGKIRALDLASVLARAGQGVRKRNHNGSGRSSGKSLLR